MFLKVCCVIMLLSSCVSTRFCNEEKTIQLKGNPTTGYNWFYQISDDSIIAVEEYYRTQKQDDETIIYETLY